ncbi:putative head to tail connector [Alteromonas phage vB_AspP-H4/4]|uniref:Head to tail connector n=1 Tax=Alteromonas phage vB_AspP-H4/4 TaxID=2928692 RepID=A0A220YL72_9CAUD|nr:head-tail adaptor [Alteromonas phage vB_AspP-H4/4]ASL24415.1 putative head to tail connector [Alteromonas phage vB_AspP-H4/4]
MDINALQAKYLTHDFKLKGEFAGGCADREEVLTKAERYAGWTLPMIFPDDPLEESEEMQNDFQSVGAQSVNNLSNKIMMALFQPAKPFFRMTLAKAQEEQLLNSGMSKANIDAALAESEREAMRELEKAGARVALIDIIVQLIITGNSMLYMPPDDDVTVYSMRDYTIKRDLRGNPTKIIIKETKTVDSLGDDLAAVAHSAGYSETDEVALYTGIVKTRDRYMVWQEMEDICYCHKRVGYYTKDTLPWIPLTWQLARGKNYGTGLVEQYSGDFSLLSTFAEAMVDYATVVTDVKNLVNPTGMTDVRALTEAPSGAYVQGREQDIFAYTASKDMGQASAFLNERFDSVARRVASAFLLNSQVTRDAERVTAEEIRMQAHELESSLGGVYSRLASELQLPLAKRLMRKIDPAFKNVEPTIVTGFDSLSRNSELDNIRALIQDLAGVANLPDAAAAWIDMGNLIAMLGAGHGVEYSKFLKDAQKVAEEGKARMQAQAQAAGMEAQAVAQGQGQQNA